MKLALLSALSAALMAAQSSAVEPSQLDHSSQFAQAFERDLRLAKTELPRYAIAESQAARIENQAKDFLGSSYAGSWFERNPDGSYSHIVASTNPTDAMVNAGATVRVVAYSLSDLDATLDTLSTKLSDLYSTQPMVSLSETAAEFGDLSEAQGLVPNSAQADAIQFMYVDVRTNSVVVHVDSNALTAGIDFVASTDADIGTLRIEPTQGEPQLLANIWGGREYVSGGGFCSVGFAVRRGNQNAFATAGHCGPRGTRVSVGGENVGSVAASSFPGDDMAYATARSSDRLWGAVDFYNGGSVLDYNIRGSRVAAIGAVICRSGRTTGLRCGNITSRNVTVNYGTGPVRGLTQATACAGRGDSGGSWVSAGNQAQGVTSGGQLTNGNDNCGASTPVTWFQPVREILSRYNLQLVTR